MLFLQKLKHLWLKPAALSNNYSQNRIFYKKPTINISFICAVIYRKNRNLREFTEPRWLVSGYFQNFF
jgi:hypothetical protein